MDLRAIELRAAPIEIIASEAPIATNGQSVCRRSLCRFAVSSSRRFASVLLVSSLDQVFTKDPEIEEPFFQCEYIDSAADLSVLISDTENFAGTL